MTLSFERLQRYQLPDLQIWPKSSEPKVVDIPKAIGIMTEVDQLPLPEQKKRLLYHQFRAQLKEEMGFPFHSYGMSLRKSASDEMSWELHDQLYQHSQVLDRCQRAIEVAQTEAEKIRFIQERSQVVQLLSLLEEKILKLNYSLLHTLAADQPNDLPTRWATIEALQRQGWQFAPLISPEVAWQFNIKLSARCLAGPKFFYIMPRSPVHKGWKTMYLIAQPVYLPETDQWLVLQDQHMCDANWEDYDQVLEYLNGGYPVKKSHKEGVGQREQRIMAECIVLPETYQFISALETFKQVIYQQFGRQKQLKNVLSTQEKLEEKYRHLEHTFELHCDYLLGILQLEKTWGTDWDSEKKERLFQAYVNTYASLYHQEAITDNHVKSWVDSYLRLYIDPEARNKPVRHRHKHRLASAKSAAPWLLLSIESKFECSALALPSALARSLLNLDLLDALKTNNLTFTQLQAIIGEERAKRWKLGTCVACGESGVWIGDKNSGLECDVCIACEMKDNGLSLDHQPAKSSLTKNNYNHITSPNANTNSKFLSDETLTLTRFLSSI